MQNLAFAFASGRTLVLTLLSLPLLTLPVFAAPTPAPAKNKPAATKPATSKPAAPKSVAPTSLAPVESYFPHPKNANIKLMLIPVNIPASPLVEASDWRRLALVQQNKDATHTELVDLGVMVAKQNDVSDFIEPEHLPKIPNKNWNEVTMDDLMESFAVWDDGSIKISFKAGDQGQSYVTCTGYEGPFPGSESVNKGVTSIALKYDTGKVNLNYTADTYLNSAFCNGRDPILNLYFLSALVLPSGKRIVNPSEVRAVQYKYPLEKDVNAPNVLSNSIRRQANAAAVLLNKAMANLDECVDNASFLTESLQRNQTSVGRRIFSEIRLPAQEINTLHMLADARKSGNTARVKSLTKLLNRMLIDRLLMSRWRGDRYLFSSSVFRLYDDLANAGSGPFTREEMGALLAGKVGEIVLPPPSPLLNMQYQLAHNP